MADTESITGIESRVIVPRRHLQVALLAAEGLTAADIAARLGISPLTLRAHLMALVRRLPPPAPGRPSLLGRVADAARASTYVAVERPPLAPAPSPRRDGGMAVRCAVPASISSGVNYIYAIRRPDTAEVKIGISRDPVFRLSGFQCAHGAPLELVLCIPGTEEEEKALHAGFHADRLLGEWFRESPAITAWIAEHAQ